MAEWAVGLGNGTGFSYELAVHLPTNQFTPKHSSIMLRWSVIFFVVALIAAVFGFGGIAAGAASVAKILFFIFLAIFVITLIAGAMKKA